MQAQSWVDQARRVGKTRLMPVGGVWIHTWGFLDTGEKYETPQRDVQYSTTCVFRTSTEDPSMKFSPEGKPNTTCSPPPPSPGLT